MKKALIGAYTTATMFAVALAQINVGGNINIGFGATQNQVNGGALLQLLALAQTIVSRLVPFAVGLAVLAFFWFLIEFIWQGRDNAEKRKTSLAGMGYAILALFVMVSIWGIVGFMGSLVGIGQGGTVPIPSVPIPAS